MESLVTLATPLGQSAAVAAATAALCWAGQILTGYWSFVDMLWSVSPVVYALLFVPWSFDTIDARTLLLISMCCAKQRRALAVEDTFLSLVSIVLITLWGARLSWNFSRKGGYSGEEDYRWSILRCAMAEVGADGRYPAPFHPPPQVVRKEARPLPSARPRDILAHLRRRVPDPPHLGL